MRRWLRDTGSALVAVVAVSACGVQAGGIAVEDLPDVTQETSLTPRSFTLLQRNDGLGGTQLTIEGRVADDHHYHAQVSYGTAGGYEELIVDDRRWVRLHDGAIAERWTEQAAGSCSEASEGLAALEAGTWVEDADGAADEFALSDGPGPLAPTTVQAVVRALDRLPEALRQADRVRPWNPQAIDYLEAQDKFDPHEQDGLRFDALPAEYDPDRVYRDGIPSAAELAEYFTYTSVWVGDGVVTRIETVVDVDPDQLDADVDRVRTLMSEQTGRPLDELPEPPLPQAMRQTLTIEPGAPDLPRQPEDAPVIALSCLGSAREAPPSIPIPDPQEVGA